MRWRWGGTIEDSQAYFDTARYLRGEIDAQSLRAPFPYRILMPWLAAITPGELRPTFALYNWLAVSVSALVLFGAARRLGYSQNRAILAGLVVVLSFPTFWYAPYLLTDPGSLCARACFVWAVLAGRPTAALAAGLVGTAIREENILLLGWLLVTGRIGWIPGLAGLAAAAGWLVWVRWGLVPGLPSYRWLPRLDQVRAALADVRSLATIALAALPLPFALAGWRNAPAPARALGSLLLLMALPPLYAALCVRVDGRAVWGMYPFLVLVLPACGLPAAPGRAEGKGKLR